MEFNIPKLAVNKSTTVFILLLIFLVFGTSAYFSLPRESTPDIPIPYIFITTVYPGVTPEDIENLITQKIEKELKSLNDVEEISSTSSEGVSQIWVEFISGMDIDDALQKVRDKVDIAKPDLPKDAEEPIITELNFSDFPIMLVNVSGDLELEKLKDMAEDLADKFETVEGVINANVSGGLVREVKVNLDPNKLVYYRLSVNDVIDTIAFENRDIPGGSIEMDTLKYLVRVPGEIEDPLKIKDLVVKAEFGKPVYVRDLAEVEYSFEERSSISRLNGKECVTISIQKRSGENLIRISDQVKEIITEEEKKLPPNLNITLTSDQSKDIRRMVKDLENNIISGLILVVLCLFLAMGIRNSLFVAVAIPLSMLMTFIILSMLGITLNMVVLFSLIMVLGMLVDNAIVIVENSYRHFQEGASRIQASITGTQEVAMPVFTSTLTTIVAFAPLMFWPGIVGEFMKFLPITLIYALSCSFFVAIVFNPSLCSRFMSLKKTRSIKADEKQLTGFMKRYYYLLRWSTKHYLKTMFLSFGLLILVIILYGFLGKGVEFFPDIEPNRIVVDIKAPPGTELDTSNSIVSEIEKRIKETPDKENVVVNVGNAGGDDFGGGGSITSSRVNIDLFDREFRSQSSLSTLDYVRNQLRDISGATIKVDKPQEGPPTGKPVNIEITGDDFKLLGELSHKIRDQIKDVPGLINLTDDYELGKPEIRVEVDREKAAFFKLNTYKIASYIRTAVNGTEASKYRVGDEEYDITVRFQESARKSIEDLEKIIIYEDEKQIPLTAVAKVTAGSGLSHINHKDQKRMVTLQGEVAENYNSNAVRQEVEKIVKEMELPTGYNHSFTGENKEQDEAKAFLSQAFWIALFLIALVIVTQFDSVIITMVILFSVILSTIGALIGLIVTRTPFGIIMTGIGVISLAGVVVNNAIVLIDYTQLLRKRGFDKLEAITQAGLVRFRPVILTAVATVLGLIPLTTGVDFDFIDFKFNLGGESSQWWGPMGAAVIFGLSFATILTLVVVPAMYIAMTNLSERVPGALKRLFGIKRISTTF